MHEFQNKQACENTEPIKSNVKLVVAQHAPHLTVKDTEKKK